MSPDRADVVIVGGRIAGASLAVHLARAGVGVCIVDKARFPSDTASTHIIQPRGTAALQRLGVLSTLRRDGAADISGVTLRYADVRLDVGYSDASVAAQLSTGTTPGLSWRRTGLDAALLGAAQDAGAQVRTRTTVHGLMHDGAGRVAGVRTSNGDIRARLVVGADGRSSTVARLVGARTYGRYRAPRMAAWAYVAGAGAHGNRLRIGRMGNTALIATPAGDDLLLVGVIPAVGERDAFLADRDAGFDERVRQWPELHALVDGAERVGPLRVVPDWTAYFRESAGAGWVLTGDAGNFKDPSAAQGITDALRQSETLAAAVLAPNADPDASLRAWWRWRDGDCRDMHWFARLMGAGGPTTPVLTEIVRDVADQDPALFAALLNRDVPSRAVLTPGRVGRAVARAVGRRPASLPAIGREALLPVGTGGRQLVAAVRRRVGVVTG